MKKSLNVTLAILILFLVPMRALAWDDMAHMVIAQIAYSRLSEPTRRNVEELSRRLSYGKYAYRYTPITVAVYMDDLRADPVYDYLRAWHYIDKPIYADDSPRNVQKAEESAATQVNVLTQIKAVTDKLKAGGLQPFEEAQYMAFLIHMVGDAHQPLHCATLYSSKYPQGDAGGNRYLIKGDERNLHAYWDSAGLLFKSKPLNRPLSKDDIEEIDKYTRDVMSTYPVTEQDWKDMSVDTWVNESYEEAKFAYSTPEDRKPSSEYQEETQRRCKIRLAKAGYRLALLLNEIYGVRGPLKPEMRRKGKL